jgi:hypothetical protein
MLPGLALVQWTNPASNLERPLIANKVVGFPKAVRGLLAAMCA